MYILNGNKIFLCNPKQNLFKLLEVNQFFSDVKTVKSTSRRAAGSSSTLIGPLHTAKQRAENGFKIKPTK